MSQTPKGKQTNLFSFFKKTPTSNKPSETSSESKTSTNSILSPKRSPNATKGKEKNNNSKTKGWFDINPTLLGAQ